MTKDSLMRSFTLLALSLAGCTTTPDEAVPVALGGPANLDVASKPEPDLCATLAAQATALLASAQRCNVAAANPTQCASWVPSIDGCEQPVAYAGSDESRAYLEVFELYAKSCPLPDRPCVDPSLLTVDCTQAADIDSLVGSCAITSHP